MRARKSPVVALMFFLVLAATSLAQSQVMSPGNDPGGETPQGSGTTYYVSNSGGSDSNTGLSSSVPWQTVGKVTNFALVPGDTVLFKRNDTWSTGELSLTRSGSSGNPITYGAYGTGARPKIVGDTTFPLMLNESWIVIDRLHFNNGQPLRMEGVSNVIWQYNEISKRSRTCLAVKENSSFVTIQFNKIHDCGEYSTGGCGFDCPAGINGEGVYLGSAQSANPNDFTHDVTVRSNEIFNTTDSPIDIKEKMDTIIIEDNILHTSIQNLVMAGAIIINDGSDNPSTNVIIRRNVFHTLKGVAVLRSSGDPRVVNNLFYNVLTGNGIRIRSGASGDYYHNTIYGIAEAGKVPIQIDSGASGYDIKNNIGPGTTNNLATNAMLFVNAPGGDFRLRGGSAAINTASDVGITTDILGVVRPQGGSGLFDYGAYELAPQVVSCPPGS